MPVNPVPETTEWQSSHGCAIRINRTSPVGVELLCQTHAADLGSVREGTSGWYIAGPYAGLVMPPDKKGNIWGIIRELADAHHPGNAVVAEDTAVPAPVCEPRRQVDDVMYYIAGDTGCHLPCCADCYSACCPICMENCLAERTAAEYPRWHNPGQLACQCGCPECFCAVCPRATLPDAPNFAALTRDEKYHIAMLACIGYQYRATAVRRILQPVAGAMRRLLHRQR